jgi:hypothetical protein
VESGAPQLKFQVKTLICAEVLGESGTAAPILPDCCNPYVVGGFDSTR